MRTLVLIAVLALSACATPEQRAERLIAVFGPACDKFGYERGTDGWRNCVMEHGKARGTTPLRATCSTVGGTTSCY